MGFSDPPTCDYVIYEWYLKNRQDRQQLRFPENAGSVKRPQNFDKSTKLQPQLNLRRNKGNLIDNDLGSLKNSWFVVRISSNIFWSETRKKKKSPIDKQ